MSELELKILSLALYPIGDEEPEIGYKQGREDQVDLSNNSGEHGSIV